MIEKDNRILIEDNYSDFKYQKNQSNLKIKFSRISFIFFIFFIISLIYFIHLIHLGSRKNPNLNKLSQSTLNNLHRTEIVDRNGKFLVKSLNSVDIGISTPKIIDKKKLLLNLKYIFPDKNYETIKSNFDTKKFFYFEKKITDEKYEQLMNLGDKSIQVEKKLIRIYPEKNLFSHIIGQIDNENNGISGLEKSLNKKLKERTEPIILSVDTDIQFLIRNELIKFDKIFKTLGSAAILMNIDNG